MQQDLWKTRHLILFSSKRADKNSKSGAGGGSDGGGCGSLFAAGKEEGSLQLIDLFSLLLALSLLLFSQRMVLLFHCMDFHPLILKLLVLVRNDPALLFDYPPHLLHRLRHLRRDISHLL